MRISEDDYLAHYGILRRSGRYPWGSGNNLELETARSFLDYVAYLKKKLGLSDKQVAEDLGLKSVDELKAKKAIAKNEEKAANVAMAVRLSNDGWSNTEAAKRMGIPESTYRSYLEPGAADTADLLTTTANVLKSEVDANFIVDVSKGVEHHLGVTDTRMKTAIALAQEDGYEVYTVPINQLGTGKDTKTRVLVPPGTTQKEAWERRGEIVIPMVKSDDGGRTYGRIDHPPMSIDPKRLEIKYGDEGGAQADGVIFVRPGVEDISLGASNYAQVRVKVGDGHYLKGMAVYKDDLPDGVDLMFNTNKTREDAPGKLDALKKLEDDPKFPFGTVIRDQVVSDRGLPTEKLTSAMNIVNQEGNWKDWSSTLSSQMLSKQDPRFIKEQLDLTFDRREKEFNRIMELTNPVVREKLLKEFSDGADSAATHLKAAALTRTGNHVILPLDSISPTEVYAPNFIPGETVVLIRHPHGGRFEIPELTVTNKNPEGNRLIGKDSPDAIGIHHSVAERLSGADFDGDTVLVIPNNRGKIKTAPALEGLKGFDPRIQYKGYDGMKKMTNTQTEMGIISNLITDMTLKGASNSEIARAVRHSMVVIDAEKHGLNHKQSYIDNGIKSLKEKYQIDMDTGKGGAATLISRAGSKKFLDQRQLARASEGGPIDPKTGKLRYVPTGRINKKTGKPVQQKHKLLDVTDDAFELSSGTPAEQLYAAYSNRTKDLANRARKELLNTPRLERNPSAAKAYKKEVDELTSALRLAERNAPLERRAQALAGASISAIRRDSPHLTKDQLKKIKFQELDRYRERVGAKKNRIEITPRQWEAIQAGAVSHSRLTQILNNADLDIVRELATPRPAPLMSPAKTQRAQSLLKSGATRAEVARQLGVSLTTLDLATNG